MPLGMLDEPLRRLLHRGRKPPPEKRAVGDLEIVPRGRRRDAQTAGHEIPVAPSLRGEPALIGGQSPSQRGLSQIAARWSDREADAFDRATAPFESVDEEERR